MFTYFPAFLVQESVSPLSLSVVCMAVVTVDVATMLGLSVDTAVVAFNAVGCSTALRDATPRVMGANHSSVRARALPSRRVCCSLARCGGFLIGVLDRPGLCIWVFFLSSSYTNEDDLYIYIYPKYKTKTKINIIYLYLCIYIYQVINNSMIG